jgi:hypothetical protein
MNVAKWSAEYLQANGRLPVAVSELPNASDSGDSVASPLRDAWGHPLLLSQMGKGFEVRAPGADGVLNSGDDITHRVDDPHEVK